MTIPRLIAVSLVAGLLSPGLLAAQRRPLSVSPITQLELAPTPTRKRFDPVTNVYSDYEVETRVDFVRDIGTFYLSWNGEDGRRHQMRWEPGDGLSGVVAADVTFDPSSGLYTYSYSVTNLESSRQRLEGLFVEAGMPEQVESPSENWYSRRLTPHMREELSVPDGWAWSWVMGSNRGLLPGRTLDGFQIVSRMPPGVVRAYVEGLAPPPTNDSEVEGPQEIYDAIGAAQWRIPEGFTIGPVAPNEDVRSEARRMLAELDEAERQGWLRGASANELRRSVGEVRDAIIDGELADANARVSAVIEGLEDDPSGEAPLSEVRALLRHRLPALLRAR